MLTAAYNEEFHLEICRHHGQSANKAVCLVSYIISWFHLL